MDPTADIFAHDDPELTVEVRDIFLDRGWADPYELLIGLLRGTQTMSLLDPVWWPTMAPAPRPPRTAVDRTWGVLVLGELRVAGRGRLPAAIVLVAHVLEERAPVQLLALATRLLATGHGMVKEPA